MVRETAPLLLTSCETPTAHTEDLAPTTPATFLIIDDQPVVSYAMQSLIASQPGWRVVSHVGTLEEGREVSSREHPTAVLLGSVRPGEGDFEFLRWLRESQPRTASIVHSAQPEAVYAHRCIRAGASAYVGKDASVGVLLCTITLAMNGATVVNGHAMDRMTTSFIRSGTADGVESLSQRELEVLHLLGEGMSTHQIAEVMYRSIKTIESHRYRIGQKLKISSGAELVRFALCHQIASTSLAADEAA